MLSATSDASAIVAFDMFYKVTRFAAMSYLIGAETFCLSSARGTQRKWGRIGSRNSTRIHVGFIADDRGLFAIAMFGEKIFGVILNHNE